MEAIRLFLLEVVPRDKADSRGPLGRREGCSLGILAAVLYQDIQSTDQEDNQSRGPGSGQELGDTGGTWRVRGYKGSRAGQGNCTVAHSGTEVGILAEVGNLVEVENLVEVGNLVEDENLVGVDNLAKVDNLAEAGNLVEVGNLAEVGNLVEIDILLVVDNLVVVENFVEVDILVDREPLEEQDRHQQLALPGSHCCTLAVVVVVEDTCCLCRLMDRLHRLD